MLSFRTVLLLCAAPLMAIAQYTCDDPPSDFECLCPQFMDTLQCKVCGYQGSSPIRCTAYNATFDNIPIKKNATAYQDTTWTSALVAQKGPANPILPSSKNRYLRSLTGYATASFTSGFSYVGNDMGGLFNFSYACAEPCTTTTSQRPVACELTVTGACSSYSPDDQEGYVFYYDQTFAYQPAAPRWASMARGVWNNEPDTSAWNSSREYYPGVCFNYTFEAVMANGSPAFLYLDDVIVQSWTS